MKIVYADKVAMTSPTSGEVIVDSYWCVHPEKGISFADSARCGSWDLARVSPQCNRDKRVADMIQAKIYPDHVVEKIPQVFIGNLYRHIEA